MSHGFCFCCIRRRLVLHLAWTSPLDGESILPGMIGPRLGGIKGLGSVELPGADESIYTIYWSCFSRWYKYSQVTKELPFMNSTKKCLLWIFNVTRGCVSKWSPSCMMFITIGNQSEASILILEDMYYNIKICTICITLLTFTLDTQTNSNQHKTHSSSGIWGRNLVLDAGDVCTTNSPLLITLPSTYQSPRTVKRKASVFTMGTVRLSSDIVVISKWYFGVASCQWIG